MSDPIITTTCDYCSAEQVETRSVPYIAEIRGPRGRRPRPPMDWGGRLQVCRACWDDVRRRGDYNEGIDVGEFDDSEEAPHGTP